MKRDWATKKVDNMLKRWTTGKQQEGWAAPLVRLLRVERRRAVRICRQIKAPDTLTDFNRTYNLACEDCANAIKG